MIEYYNQLDNYGFITPNLCPTKPLYRYRSNIEYAIDEISNSHIFLSSVDNLNDPFDFSYIISFEDAKMEIHSGKYFYEILKLIKTTDWILNVEKDLKESGAYNKEYTMEEFFTLLTKYVKKYTDYYSSSIMMDIYYKRIYGCVNQHFGCSASFSEKNDNILMWAHYADSHKGVCLGYDLSMLDLNDIKQKVLFSSMKKVWYSSERYNDSQGLFTPFIKAQEWSYEQEWRLYNKNRPLFVKFPCLQSVYLGAKFDYESESMEKIVSSIKKCSRDINMYACRPDNKTYKINLIKINN